MEIHEEVKVGVKVTPHSKSYAQDLSKSEHWNKARSDGQPYLYINAIVPSRTQKYYYVLGYYPAKGNAHAGDFFTLEDFELYYEN